MASLDVWRHEYRDKQQQQDKTVYRIGVCLVKAIVEKQDYASKGQGKTYPEKLLSAESVEIEKAFVVEIVARGVYADGSGHDQNQKQQDRDPVEIAENARIGISAF